MNFTYLKLLIFMSIITTIASGNENSGSIELHNADLIIYNAKIYQIDERFSICEAIVVKDGQFIFTGSSEEALSKFRSDNSIDMEGKFIYPGFHDSHCHFYGYGLELSQVDLRGAYSFGEVVEKALVFAKNHTIGWITGRGWDQNLWEVKEFPDRSLLDQNFPDRPVFLRRIDGHAAIANKKALELAGITAGMKIEGGIFETKDGQLTGILIDKAMEPVFKAMPPVSSEQQELALLKAEDSCFSYGITSVADAGLDKSIIDLIDEMQKSGRLKIRTYIMANPNNENFQWLKENGPYKTPKMNVRSFKYYADGAMGSRGAYLLEPYTDDPENKGLLLVSEEYLAEQAKLMYEIGFQMNTHCIGDGGCRAVIKAYSGVLQSRNDLRWRLEHAQTIDHSDLQLIKEYRIIPSTQPVHATSDREWVVERLGNERMKSAYANKSLMKQNGWIAFGSDFPIEPPSPVLGFLAAVFSKTETTDTAFVPDEAVTREEALKAFTIWGAKAQFEEDEKGSIEAGKFADFIIIDTDLLNASFEEILNAKILFTYVDGKMVYMNKN